MGFDGQGLEADSVSLVASADFEDQAGYGQIPQLYTKALLHRSDLFEVCLADTEGNWRVESYNSLIERQQDSRQGFELLL